VLFVAKEISILAHVCVSQEIVVHYAHLNGHSALVFLAFNDSQTASSVTSLERIALYYKVYTQPLLNNCDPSVA
jgi:hypothetical protein